MIRIIIIDDHPMLVSGIKNAVEASQHITVIGTYSNSNALLKALSGPLPDVLLLDLYLGNHLEGKELITLLKRDFPQIRILVLTSNDNAFNIQMILNAGADGYILKNIEQNHLFEAIKKVHTGEEYLSPEVKNILLDSLRKGNQKSHGVEILTEREIEVLRLIAEEKTSHEIGAALNLSYRTIETYRLGIMQKLGVKNMVGMVKKAIVLGIIK